MFRRLNHKSLSPSSYVGRVSSPRVSRLPLTTLGGQYRITYAWSLAAARRSGVRNEAGFDQYRFRHHVGSKPDMVSTYIIEKNNNAYGQKSSCEGISSKRMAYPHGRVQGPSDLVVLLQPWTAPQNLWQPELADGALHMPNLSLRRCRRFDPL